MGKIFAHLPASNDYGDINVAFDAGFTTGWRSGARFMARAVNRLRPKPNAPSDKRVHQTNGNGSDNDSPMLPL